MKPLIGAKEAAILIKKLVNIYAANQQI